MSFTDCPCGQHATIERLRAELASAGRRIEQLARDGATIAQHYSKATRRADAAEALLRETRDAIQGEADALFGCSDPKRDRLYRIADTVTKALLRERGPGETTCFGCAHGGGGHEPADAAPTPTEADTMDPEQA